MISRMSPDLDYLAPESFDSVGASQIVIGGGVLHWSGIVAARSVMGKREFPADSVADELAWILTRVDACLVAGGSSRAQLLTMTMFSTDLGALGAALGPVFAPWAGVHRPTLTCIGVAQLAYPDIHIEVQGSALVDT